MAGGVGSGDEPHRNIRSPPLTITSCTKTRSPNHGCQGYRSSKQSVTWALRRRVLQRGETTQRDRQQSTCGASSGDWQPRPARRPMKPDFSSARRSKVGGKFIEAEVCVVGGGVGGITLALEFEKRGVGACLIESGGFAADEATRDLYRGESIGLPYLFADGCRCRFLGGRGNCLGRWGRAFGGGGL